MTATDVRCIAAARVDGGTRFAWEVDPATFEDEPVSRPQATTGRPNRAPAVVRAALDQLRVRASREQEKAWREQGGRWAELPLPPRTLWTRGLAAKVLVTGSRRETITLHVLDLAHVRINVETGAVRLQLKARGLWSEGYEATAARWLDLVTWWCTGLRVDLTQSAALGWRTTGVELCSDFVGIDFRDEDAAAFVGFRASDIIRRFSRHGAIETINLGTRASPVSLCIYDKDVQLVRAKGGDDSTYRRVHEAGGWDGVSKRRRVEFRLSGRGLHYEDRETGEVIDLRDPATLADRDALATLWAHLASKKRLVDPGSATRRERCTTDPRWSAVRRLASRADDDGAFRQTRELQADAWQEATRRAQRDARRALHRCAALHDVPHETVSLAAVLRFIEDRGGADELAALREYQGAYRALREAFIGEEISDVGAAQWAAYWSKARGVPDDDDPQSGQNDGLA